MTRIICIIAFLASSLYRTNDVIITSVQRRTGQIMAKETVFTMKLESELRAAFMAEAAGEDRPASQIMRELMRGYIEERRKAREYEDFLRGKIEAARLSVHAGIGRTNAEVEAAFSARRKAIGEA